MARTLGMVFVGLGVVLLVAVGLYGFYVFRPVGSAEVPAGAVPAGWTDKGEKTEWRAGGVAKIFRHQYEASSLGSVSLVVVTPVPFVDLKAQVDQTVRDTLAKNKASATLLGPGEILIGAVRAAYDEYAVTANDGTWNGRLLRATYKCPGTNDFVASIAFGMTDRLGLAQHNYDQARDMVEASRCR